MANIEVHIPDIGDDGEVEVIELLVAPGDSVEVDDGLVLLESDKATMEVPSTAAGTVKAVRVAVGDQVATGQLVVELETDGASAPEARAPAAGAEPTGESAGDPDPPSPAEPASADAAAGAGSSATAEIDVVVPDIGDSGEVEVIELLVAVGDTVAVDDGLVVLESDKATMEVPSTVAGEVLAVSVSVGDQIGEGAVVVRVRGAGDAPSAPAPADTPAAPAKADAPAPAAPAGSEAAPAAAASPAAVPPADAAKVYAGPAVRKLARELGVDLTRVSGTGDKQRILKEDVHGFVKQALTAGPAAGASPSIGGTGIPPIPAVDFSRFGEVEEVPLSRTMRAGATNLHRSWLNLPHVTQHDDADVTELEIFRKAMKPEAERAGVKLTPLPFLMKVAAAALAEFPRVAGSFAADGEHYVLKKYCHIGFAVDTPDGLLVPVVRDVDRKGVFELSTEIAELSERARTKKLKPADMQGGVFSLSSLGNIGGTGFTPIVNAPEVAILGVSRLTKKPVWNGSEFVPRDMLPLSLSYDHKAINGAEAGRFLTWYATALADVRRLLL